MNSFSHAQKGFKTFLITLTISLVIFTALYYLLSGGKNGGAGAISQADIQDYMAANSKESPFEDLSKEKIDIPKRTILSATDTATPTPTSVVTPQPTPPTRTRPTPAVLAESTVADPLAEPVTTTTIPQTTTSAGTVPATGVDQITMALIATGVALLFGFYILYLGPRRMALKSFERSMTEIANAPDPSTSIGSDFENFWS